ncbi:DinB family protein [Paenibacillus sp. P22]|uniref:DinB family protein n=1 Tax=Paenibacillus sp. P22 TaxID=483908 RepID=UPI00038FCBDC|nr:DinB family protein [Paenibacillus sp. P22]
MSQPVLHTSQVLRQIAIGHIQAIDESLFDRQPAGFNNTIRWNVGHIVYWLDRYASMSFGLPSSVPDSYGTLFSSGTKPADWEMTPPSKEELVGMLGTQLDGLSELTGAMLEQQLDSPFIMGSFRFDTAGELFNFALVHEAIHLGTITSLLKTAK